MLIPELSAQLQELDSTSELCHDDIFDILCEEFNLDSEYIEAKLTCKCPYAERWLCRSISRNRRLNMPYRYVDRYWVYHFVERLINLREDERDSTAKHFPEALKIEQIFDSLVLANDLVRSNGVSYARKWLQDNSYWANGEQRDFLKSS